MPRVDNAVIHLGIAVGKLGAWETPMHLNETTRAYFERLASISPPDKAAVTGRCWIRNAPKQVQRYLAENEPVLYSMLRTSVVPTMMKAGVGANVIPSEAEATLDIRALPGEDIDEFYDEMRRVIDDPAVKIVPIPATRPEAPPSRLDTEMYRVLERVSQADVSRLRGSSDDVDRRFRHGAATRERHSVLWHRSGRNRGGSAQYGAHSDVERFSESSLYQFVEFAWNVVREIAVRN